MVALKKMGENSSRFPTLACGGNEDFSALSGPYPEHRRRKLHYQALRDLDARQDTARKKSSTRLFITWRVKLTKKLKNNEYVHIQGAIVLLSPLNVVKG